jgi:hypothetical protein
MDTTFRDDEQLDVGLIGEVDIESRGQFMF